MDFPFVREYSRPAKHILNIFKIEVFDGDKFKRWQKSIFSILDMHEVAFTLTEFKPTNSF
ncbi:hypothetical protein J1N35_038954 [Gossypium stocksii]|uniref:Uncharacterized protein n=1 Tax=Gossypium stocksii TaxID=47602 RepID=A0A9D3ZND9_9ROSI|nr:hypothetical protein J1N35_038954 [Gossypium stocksii]